MAGRLVSKRVVASLQDLRIAYPGKGAGTLAVDGVSLDVHEGEVVSILGPSGCGKSSLLNALGGFVPTSGGTIEFRPPHDAIRQGDIAVMFQDHGLFPWLTALENAALRLTYRGHDQAEREQQAMHMLGQVGLEDDAAKFPHELSGGMKQRVGIARAMLGRPRMLLMDEPFGALDSLTRIQMQELFASLLKGKDIPVVLVTHDVAEAVFLSDRIAIMAGAPGRIERIVEIRHDGERDRQFLRSSRFDAIRREVLELLL